MIKGGYVFVKITLLLVILIFTGSIVFAGIPEFYRYEAKLTNLELNLLKAEMQFRSYEVVLGKNDSKLMLEKYGILFDLIGMNYSREKNKIGVEFEFFVEDQFEKLSKLERKLLLSKLVNISLSVINYFMEEIEKDDLTVRCFVPPILVATFEDGEYVIPTDIDYASEVKKGIIKNR